MTETQLFIDHIPAVLYGESAPAVWLFVHGKCGCKEEGAAFARIVCPKGAQVLAIDLPEHGARQAERGFDPWHAVPELQRVAAYLAERWGHFSLRANSIGAWFSLLALGTVPPQKALLVSPLLDMGGLIENMMRLSGVDEARLEKEGCIDTTFGETLSWQYLQYVRAHPLTRWDAPTEILYAGGDNMTSRATVDAFVSRFGCGLTVMDDGEHWFHTPPQLSVLQSWEKANT